MSKKDYTKFSKSSDKSEEKCKVEKTEPQEEPVQFEFNLEAKPGESIIIEPAKPKTGRVVNCRLLNVRKAPDITAEIVTTIPVDAKVKIYEKESTDLFYKVENGYCMKQFINVK